MSHALAVEPPSLADPISALRYEIERQRRIRDEYAPTSYAYEMANDAVWRMEQDLRAMERQQNVGQSRQGSPESTSIGAGPWTGSGAGEGLDPNVYRYLGVLRDVLTADIITRLGLTCDSTDSDDCQFFSAALSDGSVACVRLYRDGRPAIVSLSIY
jgi:hypothetical protein